MMLNQDIKIKHQPVFFLAFWLLLLIFTPCSDLLAAENIQVITESLNVRCGPAVTFARVGQITLGQQLPLLQQEGDWAEIQLADGSSGWVLVDYVKIITAASAYPQSVVITGNSVNLRSGPGTTFSIIGGLSKETVLPVVSQQGDWYQVKLPDGDSGWISAGFAKAVSDDPAEESTTPAPTPSTAVAVPAAAPVVADAAPTSKIKGLVVNASSLNVRLAPSISAGILTTIPQGTRLNYLAKSGDWFQVSLADRRLGWVASSLVNFSTKAVSSWIPPLPEIPQPEEQEASDDESAENDQNDQDDGSGLAGKTIVIDPGHGSTQNTGWLDPGAVGPSGVQEYEVVMNIAAELAELLEEAGADVVLTREGETDLSLDGRTQLANELSADVFVCIHANSAPTNLLSGTATYYYLAPVAGDAAQVSCRKTLAQSIQSALVDRLERADLGVRQENFAVLRTTLMPSVLVETAFLSNPEEEVLLSEHQFQRKAARGIFAGLEEYFQEIE